MRIHYYFAFRILSFIHQRNDGKKCTGDIIVFISQDIKILRNDWLYYLTKDIVEGNCEAAYSRQLAEKNNIEKYTREKNYPDKSFVKTKKDIGSMGLNTFFFRMLHQQLRGACFVSLDIMMGKNLPRMRINI